MVVKLGRNSEPFCALVVGMLMLGWLMLTNHCALGLMERPADASAEHACCNQGQNAPGQDSPSDGVFECCKAIHAAIPGKAVLKFDATKFHLQIWATVQVLARQAAVPQHPICVFDHGPPFVVSFAESVLQRSLLGHAPPLV